MSDYETIVVGLGAAGAAAARKLSCAGVSVLALEAGERVGGRVCTATLGDGVIELGAEWIHGTCNSSTYDLATENNVTLQEQTIFFEPLSSDGSKADSDLVNRLASLVMSDVEEAEASERPLGELLARKTNKVIKEEYPDIFKNTDLVQEYLHFLDLLVRNYTSAPTWMDLASTDEYKHLDGHQHMCWGKTGYKTLFDILLKTYNNGPGLPSLTVKLNSEVSSVSYSSDPRQRVAVTTTDGRRYTADNVIVTVSLGVLKARHTELFIPKLPVQKSSAIDTLAIGVMDKVVFLFDRPWWPEVKGSFFGFLWRSEDRKSLPAGDEWLTQVFAASTPRGCARALTLWTSGDVGKMVETMPEDLVKSKLMGLLRRFLGKIVEVPEPISMIRSTWYTNPYTRGSYSYDSMASYQLPNAREYLAQPITDNAGNPRILFAGEATHPHHYSTVHGAVDTGYREATRLLERRAKLLKHKL